MKVEQNGDSLTGRFNIKMFKFIGDTLNDVWLHCTVRACNTTAGKSTHTRKEHLVNIFQHHVSLIVMVIPVNVVVSTVASYHLSLLVTILKPNFQSKEEMKAVKKFSLSKKETQTVLHSPVS